MGGVGAHSHSLLGVLACVYESCCVVRMYRSSKNWYWLMCLCVSVSVSLCLSRCPRQDSGQGESDSDKQSYDESDDSTDNQAIDTDEDQVLLWKKGKLLGKGAYGRVWEGLTDSTRMIAVKEVELDFDCQEKAESVSCHSNKMVRVCI